MPRIFDISLPIDPSTPVYPGNPDIHVESQQSVQRGDSANVSLISFGSHTGTHVDAPKHFFDDGAGVDRLALDRLVGPVVLIDTGEAASIGRAELETHQLAGHKRVLFKTRNSRRGFAPFKRNYTYLAPDGAEYLVELGIDLAGIDALSIEQFHSGHHRTHLILLGAGVVIVEGLNLQDVSPGIYQLVCLPLRLTDLDGAPARAILISETGANG